MSNIALLCVDDELTILESLRIELEDVLAEHYRIELAQDGEEALEVLADLLSENYDVPLVIADYIMPGLRGDELLQRIHALSPKTLKVMLTGQADVAGIANAINQSDLYRFIAKPWQVDDLKLTVHEAIHSYFQDQALGERTAQLEAANQELARTKVQLENYAHTLEHSEEKFHQLADNIHQVFWISTLDTSQILYASPAYEKIWGRPLEELYADSMNWANAIHSDDLDVLGQALERQTQTGEGYDLEFRITRPDGETRWIRDRSFPIRDESGAPFRMAGIADDISDRKQAEQAIRALNQQLEQQNRDLETMVTQRTKELEAFSYSVSHDLRAPLRHVQGFVNALRQRLEQRDALNDSKSAHYLQVIEKSIQRMGQLIEGLLKLSRVGRQELILRPVELQPMVQAIIDAMAPDAPDRNVEFQLGSLPVVRGDAALLQQAFTNLLSNAVKFSRDRSPATIEMGVLPDGAFFVKDNGVGFSMDYADQLFGAFQRLHSQQEFEGTGIGLSIVQRIIHRHGGEIWAESEPGKGAVFYFTLKSTL